MKRKILMSVLVCLFILGTCMGAVREISVSNTVNGRELPFYSVETEAKQVALSFDATWGNEYMKQILDVLDKYDVKATFFLTGNWVGKYPEDVKQIQLARHDIGNHSENHKAMSQLSKEACKEEIVSVHEKVKALTGIEMKLFRVPYGDYDDQVIRTAKACGYEVIQWSIDSQDWKDYGKESIVKTILKNKELKSGAIILMHSGAKYTKDALESVILGLREQGYELVPVSELIYKENYHLDVTGRQIKNK